MSIEQLQTGFLRLAKILYTREETDARRRAFRAKLKLSRELGRSRKVAAPALAA